MLTFEQSKVCMIKLACLVRLTCDRYLEVNMLVTPMEDHKNSGLRRLQRDQLRYSPFQLNDALDCSCVRSGTAPKDLSVVEM